MQKWSCILRALHDDRLVVIATWKTNLNFCSLQRLPKHEPSEYPERKFLQFCHPRGNSKTPEPLHTALKPERSKYLGHREESVKDPRSPSSSQASESSSLGDRGPQGAKPQDVEKAAALSWALEVNCL